MRCSAVFFLFLSVLFESCTGTVWYSTQDTNFKNSERVQVGVASYYGAEFHGRPTSSGEIYDMNDLTAAHPTLPLGTLVKVTNLANGKSVVVKINDRGPFKKNRIIDVSYEAAKQLGFLNDGTTLVKIEVIKLPQDSSKVR